MIAVRSKQRLVTVCVVVGLGLASGAINYANEDEKTLAGDPDEFVLVAGCPRDYPTAVTIPKETQSRIDANGDHIICSNGAGDFVDNTYVPVDDDVRLMANGHGNFFDNAKFVDPSKVVEGKVQDISFSFHGIGIEGTDYAAKGQFEFHDQTFDLRVHGDVVCLRVDDNMATLIGVVTRSNDDGLGVNSLVQWTTEDNGEGNNAAADLLSRPSRIRVRNVADCDFQPTKLTGFEILSGNIQVDEDETSGGKPTSLEEKDLDDQESESWGLSGFGNFLDEGKKIVQDISFSFHAIGTGPDGKFIENTATGKFEYSDMTPGGAGLSVAGDVLCATVTGKSAMFVGVVTKTNDKGLPMETLVTWSAEDKDDDGISQDKISRLAPIGVKLPKGICSGKVPTPTLKEVLSGGNILVK